MQKFAAALSRRDKREKIRNVWKIAAIWVALYLPLSFFTQIWAGGYFSPGRGGGFRELVLWAGLFGAIAFIIAMFNAFFHRGKDPGTGGALILVGWLIGAFISSFWFILIQAPAPGSWWISPACSALLLAVFSFDGSQWRTTVALRIDQERRSRQQQALQTLRTRIRENSPVDFSRPAVRAILPEGEHTGAVLTRLDELLARFRRLDAEVQQRQVSDPEFSTELDSLEQASEQLLPHTAAMLVAVRARQLRGLCAYLARLLRMVEHRRDLADGELREQLHETAGAITVVEEATDDPFTKLRELDDIRAAALPLQSTIVRHRRLEWFEVLLLVGQDCRVLAMDSPTWRDPRYSIDIRNAVANLDCCLARIELSRQRELHSPADTVHPVDPDLIDGEDYFDYGLNNLQKDLEYSIYEVRRHFRG